MNFIFLSVFRNYDTPIVASGKKFLLLRLFFKRSHFNLSVF